MGSGKEGQDLINDLLKDFESDPTAIWSTDFFGKSLHELVAEGLSGKIGGIPDDARSKIQTTIQRMVNEGDGGMLCILL